MCEYVLRAFLKKMYFVLLFNFWFCNFARERQRQREKFESIDRATDKKREASVVSTFCAFGVRSLF